MVNWKSDLEDCNIACSVNKVLLLGVCDYISMPVTYELGEGSWNMRVRGNVPMPSTCPTRTYEITMILW